MNYDKNSIDEQAIREADALQRQGRAERPERVRQRTGDYNRERFEKIFR